MSDSAIVSFALIAAVTGIAYGLYLAMWVRELILLIKQTTIGELMPKFPPRLLGPGRRSPEQVKPLVN